MSAERRLGRTAQLSEEAIIWRGLITGFGALVTVGGVIFALQGLGYLTGSMMTGTTLWSVLGPIIALFGLSLVVVGLRVRRR